MLNKIQIDLLREWRKQWNLAERAMKIAEKTNEVFQAPSVLELRYSGRKIVEFFDLLDVPNGAIVPEDRIRDAICDCHRARHDATDHATSIIAMRLEEARAKFGADAVRQVFPDYGKLIAKLAVARQTISESREKRNGREEFYLKIEDGSLPKIMELFEEFKGSEAELETNFVQRLLKEAGVRYGWIVALVIAVLAWLFPIAPAP